MIGMRTMITSGSMRQHIRGIDHVVLVVRDLDGARNTFERMGFTVTPRGHHTIGSQNHCVMFGDDYIELLMSPTENPHPSRQYYTEFARTGDGLAGIALKSASAKGAYTELLWAGFQPGDVLEFSRPVALPEGTREARFRVVQPRPGSTPGGRVFVCEHLTRDVVWRPGVSAARERRDRARGGGDRLRRRRADRAALRAAVRFEGEADRRGPPRRDGRHAGRVRDHAVAREAVSRRLDQRQAGAAAWRRFSCASPIATPPNARMKAGGLEPARMPDGSVALGADVAHGVALVFG